MKDYWNSDMDYGFIFNRVPMSLLGIWPLQRDNLFCKFRWSVITTIEFAIIISLLLEVFLHCDDARNILESLLVLTGAIHAINNVIISRMYLTTLARNMYSAIDDWSLFKIDEKFYSIMKRYARAGRLITMCQVIFSIFIFCFYSAFVLFSKSKEIFYPEINMTLVRRKYLIPVACLAKNVSQSTYYAIILVQMCEAVALLIVQCPTDTFFLNVILHLCGQLEILRQKLIAFGEGKRDDTDRECILKSLIRRHSKLIQLAENLEKTYCISVLVQLSLIACLMAATGIRLIFSMRHNDQIEIIRSIIILQFSILQCFLISCSGDLLLHHSESIFFAVSNMPWHDVKPKLAKDLAFVMMRAKAPLCISCGKFFYISRKTMTDMLKTAVSYVSFLQITIRNIDFS